MLQKHIVLIAALATAVLSLHAASATESLIVRTPVECSLKVDGTDHGSVPVDGGLHFTLTPGPHRLEAVAKDEKWSGTIVASEVREETFALPLGKPWWVEAESHRMWTSADNGSGLTFREAAYYCAHLALGGYKDWSLPSIEQLHDLFGGPPDSHGFHVQAPLHLTGWQWSSTAGRSRGEAWALDFGDGARASVVEGDSGLNRALCVRNGK